MQYVMSPTNISHVSCFISGSRTLSEILVNYDTLKKEHIQHSIVRRSADDVSFVKHMSFRSHGR